MEDDTHRQYGVASNMILYNRCLYRNCYYEVVMVGMVSMRTR
jgi:hypothetical protein